MFGPNVGMPGMGMPGMGMPGMGMPGMGMPGMGMPGMGMPGMGMPGMGMPGMGMPGMGMPGMGMPGVGGGSINNLEEDEDWLAGYKEGLVSAENNQESELEQQIEGHKINVLFKTTQGTQHILVLSIKSTLDEAIKAYLKRVGRPELITNNQNQICFLYNATQINLGEKKTLEQFFMGNQNPTIVVNDINNLIGA